MCPRCRQRRHASSHLPYLPISPPYLELQATTPRELLAISPISPHISPYLPHISPISPPYLPISQAKTPRELLASLSAALQLKSDLLAEVQSRLVSDFDLTVVPREMEQR